MKKIVQLVVCLFLMSSYSMHTMLYALPEATACGTNNTSCPVAVIRCTSPSPAGTCEASDCECACQYTDSQGNMIQMPAQVCRPV